MSDTGNDDDNVVPIHFGEGAGDPTRGMTPQQARDAALSPYSVTRMIDACARAHYDFDKELALGQFTAAILRAATGESGINTVYSALREVHPKIPNDAQMHKALCGSVIEYGLLMMKEAGVLDKEGDLIHPADATIMGKVVANLSQEAAIENIVRCSQRKIVKFDGKSQPTRHKAED
ncbi:MAG: hypothetical protein J0M34_02800 [Alphaproteobacteria bacterium]|nr:hypothetical protein [Alphaproteobacteria bacterium]